MPPASPVAFATPVLRSVARRLCTLSQLRDRHRSTPARNCLPLAVTPRSSSPAEVFFLFVVTSAWMRSRCRKTWCAMRSSVALSFARIRARGVFRTTLTPDFGAPPAYPLTDLQQTPAGTAPPPVAPNNMLLVPWIPCLQSAPKTRTQGSSHRTASGAFPFAGDSKPPSLPPAIERGVSTSATARQRRALPTTDQEERVASLATALAPTTRARSSPQALR